MTKPVPFEENLRHFSNLTLDHAASRFHGYIQTPPHLERSNGSSGFRSGEQDGQFIALANEIPREVSERLKEQAWKACVGNHYRGFESLPLRHELLRNDLSLTRISFYAPPLALQRSYLASLSIAGPTESFQAL